MSDNTSEEGGGEETMPQLVASSSSETDSDEEDYRQLEAPASPAPSAVERGVARRDREPAAPVARDPNSDSDASSLPQLVVSSSNDSDSDQESGAQRGAQRGASPTRSLPQRRRVQPVTGAPNVSQPHSEGPLRSTSSDGFTYGRRSLRNRSMSYTPSRRRDDQTWHRNVGRAAPPLIPRLSHAAARLRAAPYDFSTSVRPQALYPSISSFYRNSWNSAPGAAQAHAGGTGAQGTGEGVQMGWDIDAGATQSGAPDTGSGVQMNGSRLQGPSNLLSSILGLQELHPGGVEIIGFDDIRDMPLDPILQVLQASFNTPPPRKPAVYDEALDCVLPVKVDASDEELVCPISAEVLKEGEWAARMPCGHYFGHGDLLEWLRVNNSCPVCRYELPTNDASYNRDRRLSVEKVAKACSAACQVKADMIGTRMCAVREGLLRSMLDDSWQALLVPTPVECWTHAHEAALAAAKREALQRYYQEVQDELPFDELACGEQGAVGKAILKRHDNLQTKIRGEDASGTSFPDKQEAVLNSVCCVASSAADKHERATHGSEFAEGDSEEGLCVKGVDTEDSVCTGALIDVLRSRLEELRALSASEAASLETPCASPRGCDGLVDEPRHVEPACPWWEVECVD